MAVAAATTSVLQSPPQPQCHTPVEADPQLKQLKQQQRRNPFSPDTIVVNVAGTRFNVGE